MNKVTFKMTNEPWTNLGIATIINELNRQNIDIEFLYNDQYIVLKSDENIYKIISEILHNLAVHGNYNLNQNLKRISLNAQLSNYSQLFQKPTGKNGNKKTIEILPNEVQYLKEKGCSDTAKKQQIWKQRISYINNYDNYLSYGLNYDETKEYKKFSKGEKSKDSCHFCNAFYKLIDLKASVNILVSEHHNNKIDGIDHSATGRLNIKVCPMCFTASLFSLFSNYIPFFQIGQGNKRKTTLSLPKITDINILKKILNNLSLDSQYIDFSKTTNYFYSTNIKNIAYNNYAGSLISLLHNILNMYHEETVIEEDLWEDIKKEEFSEITEWIFIDKDSRKLKHIKADNRIYNILKPIDTSKGKLFLIDIIKNFPFGRALERDIEDFYVGILKLDIQKIANSIFIFSKQSINKQSFFNFSNLINFKNYFIDLICKEVIILKDEQKKAIKNIAESIGKGFHNEVGILTKFAYSTDNKDFQSALEEALFKLAKISILDKQNQYIDKDSLVEIFRILDDKEIFNEFKNYFVCFMSLETIIQNNKKE